MSAPLNVHIRDARESDLQECAICWGNRRDTYPSIYPFHLADPSITLEERLARNARDLKTMLDDEYNVFRVACVEGEDGQDRVVGYMIWSKPEALERDLSRRNSASQIPQDTVSADSGAVDLDPECNHELSAKIKAESLQVKVQFADGKRFWLLQQLFVLPSCQKRRVGTRLIEDGLRMIESTEQAKQVQDSFGKHKIGLTSSPQGQVLYERYGFKSVYWFNPHFRDKNEQGGWIERSARWPLMLKSNSV